MRRKKCWHPEIRGTVEGEIRLAMSSSICNRYFKEDFLQFRRKYPGIRAEIKEGGTEQMFDMLRRNEAGYCIHIGQAYL